MWKKGKLAAVYLLTMMGGMAQRVAGLEGHYHADRQTEPKKRQRNGRIGRGTYGENVIAGFNRKGICWSAKKNKQRAVYGDDYGRKSVSPRHY